MVNFEVGRRERTKVLVESQMVSPSWSVAREIEHNPTLAPVAFRRVRPYLSHEIFIRSSEFDVDPTSIRARHYKTLRRRSIEE